MRGRMRILWSVLVAACVFGAGSALTATADGASGDVSVTITMEAVGITVTRGAFDFGGPHPSGGTLRADYDTVHPIIENSGNVDIGSIVATFDRPPGEEATCNDGSGSWTAVIGSLAPGVDEFRLGVVVSNNPGDINGQDGAIIVPGEVGSGNALRASASPLPPTASVPFYMALRTGSAVTTGGGGCTIDLTVTAVAAG